MTTSELEQTRRIVVGVDGSLSSTAALTWAVRQAELTGSRLDVITTWEWPTTAGLGMMTTSDFNPREDAQQILDSASVTAHGIGGGVDIRSHVVAGPAGSALVDASRGADLLVVGCRGHGELAGLLLGSVSEHCVTHAHSPVLVVRDGE